MKYIFLCCMMHGMVNVALASEMDQYEGAQEGGEFDEKHNSAEAMLNLAVKEFCRSKIEERDKSNWHRAVQYTLNTHPELLELSITNETMGSPLLFALRKRNTPLLVCFAAAEKKFFGEDTNSLERRREVLREAVGNYYVDGVRVLVKYDTPVAIDGGDDLLSQLIVNCTANRLKPTCFTCCFKPKIDVQREQWSYVIAQLLIKHGAPVHHLKNVLNDYNCRGVGCSYMKKIANTPVQQTK